MFHKAFEIDDNIIDINLNEISYRAQDFINLSLYICYKIYTSHN